MRILDGHGLIAPHGMILPGHGWIDDAPNLADGSFSSPAGGWTQDGSLSYSYDGLSGFQAARFMLNEGTLIEGDQYRIQATASASGIIIRVGANADAASQYTTVGAGAVDVTLTAGGLASYDAIRFIADAAVTMTDVVITHEGAA